MIVDSKTHYNHIHIQQRQRKEEEQLEDQRTMVMMHNMAVGDANPKPMIFAIMRNGHEVIRGAMMDIRRLLDGDCDYTTAKHEWELLSRWQNLHAAMEEGCGRPNQGPIGFFK